jgi:Domain of unknown function (DUF4331)
VSHHLDTPLARQNGQLYIDDLYVYEANSRTVFAMDVNSTVTGPDITPGFSHEARYEFRIYFDGAEYEQLTYRVTFGTPDADGRQPFRLSELSGEDARSDDASGALVLEGRTGETSAEGDIRIWAGRVDDPFYIDLSLLEKVNGSVRNGTPLDLSEWDPDKAQNSFAGTTVETIVLEVSHRHPQLQAGAYIGVWCVTHLETDAGGWRQINRGGHPMIWPIFWPDDVKFTNPANTRHPSEDVAAVGEQMADLIATAVEASGTADDSRAYGQAVSGRLFPDVLPYVVGTPATYGFATFNGRTLADNAPEAMLSLVTNTSVPSGLKPPATAKYRSSEFPYVVPARALVEVEN